MRMLARKRWKKAGRVGAGASVLVLLSSVLWFVSVRAKESKRAMEGSAQAVAKTTTTTQIKSLKPKRVQPKAPGVDVEAAREHWNREGIEVSARLDELVLTCWRAQEEPQRYGRQPISRVSIQIPTNAEAEVEFDFCVEAVRFGDQNVVWSDDGVVRSEDNRKLALTGHWSPFGDPYTRWEGAGDGARLARTVQAGDPVCVKGVAPRVPDNLYAEYWGAGLGLNLFPRGAAVALNEPGFDRVEIFLSGERIPKHLRLTLDDESKADGSGQYWCLDVDNG